MVVPEGLPEGLRLPTQEFYSLWASPSKNAHGCKKDKELLISTPVLLTYTIHEIQSSLQKLRDDIELEKKLYRMTIELQDRWIRA